MVRSLQKCALKSLHSSGWCVVACRATAAQSPPASCSFRALLEEEENRLVRVGQTVAQKVRATQGFPFTAPPVARKVTFKCGEDSEPERPNGWVSSSCYLYSWYACSCPPGGTVDVSTRSSPAPSHRHAHDTTQQHSLQALKSKWYKKMTFLRCFLMSIFYLSVKKTDKMPQNSFLRYSASWRLRFWVILKRREHLGLQV